MKIKCIALCCLASFPTFASVDWSSMKATLVEEKKLANMRGKYIPNDLYFGVEMITTWNDGSSAEQQAGMNVEIRGGQVSVHAINGDYTDAIAADKTHKQGSGVVQIVQIAGMGNTGQNNAYLSIIDGAPSVDNADVTYTVLDLDTQTQGTSVGYQVRVGHNSYAMQEIRSIGSAQGVYQGISISGSQINIRNQMAMQIAIPDSWNEIKNMRVSHSLLKTLPQF